VEVPEEDVTMKTVNNTEEAAWRLASSHKVPQSAKEADPGQWWVPENVGCHLHREVCCATPAQHKGHDH
jgi:hypothetical protein